MGTRSTVKFISSHDQQTVLLSVYQQYDGYIAGAGYDLANWLKDKKVINGYSNQTMADGYANNIGCLAAQYVAAHKTKIGGFYATYPEDEQEYNYKVYFIDGSFLIEVDDIFKGTPEELLKFQESEE